MQVNKKITSNKMNQCNGLMQGLNNIYNQEGISGFFRGIGPRLLKKPMSNALIFALFEILNIKTFKF